MSKEKVEQLLSNLLLTNPSACELVLAARKHIFAAVPNASERVMYGGFMFASDAQLCGVFAYTKHISIEFARGCDLADTHRVLEGSGKLRRHIKIYTLADIQSKHLRSYVIQAHEYSCKR